MKNKIMIYIFVISLLINFSIAAQEKEKPTSVDITITSSSPDVKLNIIGKTGTESSKSVTAEKNATATAESADSEDTNSKDLMSGNPLKNVWINSEKFVRHYINYEKFSFLDIFHLFLGILLTLIAGRIARWFLENHAKKFASKTKTKIDDIFFNAIGSPISLLIFSIGFYFSAWKLSSLFSPELKLIFTRICLALGASAIAWGIYRSVEVINYSLTKLAQKTDNNLDDLIVAIIRKALKVTIAVVSVLFIGQNILNLNITTLLAGAGVLGLAVAFAAQDTIANFFGSVMIILDQPFKIGDCISVSGYKGSVENVGFRSTKIRTFDGHVVSLPNKALANVDIENIAKRPFIKKVINLGLTYDTGYKKMEKAVKILHELLDSQKCMAEDRMPRIVFDSFNDFSLNISVTIWWHHRDENGNFTSPDYGLFMKWVHKTDMEILKKFDAENLEFAFPTNTTYLAYDEKRKLKMSVDNQT